MHQLDEALSLSRQMKSHAQSGEWEDLTALEAKRWDLIHVSFKQPVAACDAEQAHNAIQEILSVDKLIHRMSSDERDRLSGELKGLNKNRRAAGAYSSNS